MRNRGKPRDFTIHPRSRRGATHQVLAAAFYRVALHLEVHIPIRQLCATRGGLIPLMTFRLGSHYPPALGAKILSAT